MPPGCGGFFIVMGCSPCLVVIDIINVLRITIKAKDHPPVSANCNGPEAFHLALELVQPKTRQLHMSNIGGGMKRRQNVLQLLDVFRAYAARVAVLKRGVSAPCGGLSLSSRAVTRHVSHVNTNASTIVTVFW